MMKSIFLDVCIFICITSLTPSECRFQKSCRKMLVLRFYKSYVKKTLTQGNNRMKTWVYVKKHQYHLLDLEDVYSRNKVIYIDKFTSFDSQCSIACTWTFVSPFSHKTFHNQQRVSMFSVRIYHKFKVQLKCSRIIGESQDVTFVLISELKPLLYEAFRGDGRQQLTLMPGTRVFCREVVDFPFIKAYREVMVNGVGRKSPYYIPPMDIKDDIDVILGCRFTYFLSLYSSTRGRLIFVKFVQTFTKVNHFTIVKNSFRNFGFSAQFMNNRVNNIAGFNLLEDDDYVVCRAQTEYGATVTLSVPACYGAVETKSMHSKGPVALMVPMEIWRNTCGPKRILATCTLLIPRQRHLQPYIFKLTQYFSPEVVDSLPNHDKERRSEETIIEIVSSTGPIAMPDTVIDLLTPDSFKTFRKTLEIEVMALGNLVILNSPFKVPWSATYLNDLVLRVKGQLHFPCTGHEAEEARKHKMSRDSDEIEEAHKSHSKDSVSIVREFTLFLPINNLKTSRNGSVKRNQLIICSGSGIPKPEFFWKVTRFPKSLKDMPKSHLVLAFDYGGNSFTFTNYAIEGIYLMTCIGRNKMPKMIRMQQEETFVFILKREKTFYTSFQDVYFLQPLYFGSGTVILILITLSHIYWSIEFYKDRIFVLLKKFYTVIDEKRKALVADIKKHGTYSVSGPSMYSKRSRGSSHLNTETFVSEYLEVDEISKEENSFAYDYEGFEHYDRPGGSSVHEGSRSEAMVDDESMDLSTYSFNRNRTQSDLTSEERVDTVKPLTKEHTAFASRASNKPR